MPADPFSDIPFLDVPKGTQEDSAEVDPFADIPFVDPAQGAPPVEAMASEPGDPFADIPFVAPTGPKLEGTAIIDYLTNDGYVKGTLNLPVPELPEGAIVSQDYAPGRYMSDKGKEVNLENRTLIVDVRSVKDTPAPQKYAEVGAPIGRLDKSQEWLAGEEDGAPDQPTEPGFLNLPIFTDEENRAREVQTLSHKKIEVDGGVVAVETNPNTGEGWVALGAIEETISAPYRAGEQTRGAAGRNREIDNMAASASAQSDALMRVAGKALESGIFPEGEMAVGLPNMEMALRREGYLRVDPDDPEIYWMDFPAEDGSPGEPTQITKEDVELISRSLLSNKLKEDRKEVRDLLNKGRDTKYKTEKLYDFLRTYYPRAAREVSEGLGGELFKDVEVAQGGPWYGSLLGVMNALEIVHPGLGVGRKAFLEMKNRSMMERLAEGQYGGDDGPFDEAEKDIVTDYLATNQGHRMENGNYLLPIMGTFLQGDAPTVWPEDLTPDERGGDSAERIDGKAYAVLSPRRFRAVLLEDLQANVSLLGKLNPKRWMGMERGFTEVDPSEAWRRLGLRRYIGYGTGAHGRENITGEHFPGFKETTKKDEYGEDISVPFVEDLAKAISSIPGGVGTSISDTMAYESGKDIAAIGALPSRGVQDLYRIVDENTLDLMELIYPKGARPPDEDPTGVGIDSRSQQIWAELLPGGDEGKTGFKYDPEVGIDPIGNVTFELATAFMDPYAGPAAKGLARLGHRVGSKAYLADKIAKKGLVQSRVGLLTKMGGDALDSMVITRIQAAADELGVAVADISSGARQKATRQAVNEFAQAHTEANKTGKAIESISYQTELVASADGAERLVINDLLIASEGGVVGARADLNIGRTEDLGVELIGGVWPTRTGARTQFQYKNAYRRQINELVEAERAAGGARKFAVETAEKAFSGVGVVKNALVDVPLRSMDRLIGTDWKSVGGATPKEAWAIVRGTMTDLGYGKQEMAGIANKVLLREAAKALEGDPDFSLSRYTAEEMILLMKLQEVNADIILDERLLTEVVGPLREFRDGARAFEDEFMRMDGNFRLFLEDPRGREAIEELKFAQWQQKFREIAAQHAPGSDERVTAIRDSMLALQEDYAAIQYTLGRMERGPEITGLQDSMVEALQQAALFEERAEKLEKQIPRRLGRRSRVPSSVTPQSAVDDLIDTSTNARNEAFDLQSEVDRLKLDLVAEVTVEERRLLRLQESNVNKTLRKTGKKKLKGLEEQLEKLVKKYDNYRAAYDDAIDIPANFIPEKRGLEEALSTRAKWSAEDIPVEGSSSTIKGERAGEFVVIRNHTVTDDGTIVLKKDFALYHSPDVGRSDLLLPDERLRKDIALYPEKGLEPSPDTLLVVQHKTSRKWLDSFMDGGIDATISPPDRNLGRLTVLEGGKVTNTAIKDSGLYVAPADGRQEAVVIVVRAKDVGLSVEAGGLGYKTGVQGLYGANDSVLSRFIKPSEVAGKVLWKGDGRKGEWVFVPNPKSPFSDRFSVAPRGGSISLRAPSDTPAVGAQALERVTHGFLNPRDAKSFGDVATGILRTAEKEPGGYGLNFLHEIGVAGKAIYRDKKLFRPWEVLAGLGIKDAAEWSAKAQRAIRDQRQLGRMRQSIESKRREIGSLSTDLGKRIKKPTARATGAFATSDESLSLWMRRAFDGNQQAKDAFRNALEALESGAPRTITFDGGQLGTAAKVGRLMESKGVLPVPWAPRSVDAPFTLRVSSDGKWYPINELGYWGKHGSSTAGGAAERARGVQRITRDGDEVRVLAAVSPDDVARSNRGIRRDIADRERTIRSLNRVADSADRGTGRLHTKMAKEKTAIQSIARSELRSKMSAEARDLRAGARNGYYEHARRQRELRDLLGEVKANSIETAAALAVPRAIEEFNRAARISVGAKETLSVKDAARAIDELLMPEGTAPRSWKYQGVQKRALTKNQKRLPAARQAEIIAADKGRAVSGHVRANSLADAEAKLSMRRIQIEALESGPRSKLAEKIDTLQLEIGEMLNPAGGEGALDVIQVLGLTEDATPYQVVQRVLDKQQEALSVDIQLARTVPGYDKKMDTLLDRLESLTEEERFMVGDFVKFEELRGPGRGGRYVGLTAEQEHLRPAIELFRGYYREMLKILQDNGMFKDWNLYEFLDRTNVSSYVPHTLAAAGFGLVGKARQISRQSASGQRLGTLLPTETPPGMWREMPGATHEINAAMRWQVAEGLAKYQAQISNPEVAKILRAGGNVPDEMVEAVLRELPDELLYFEQNPLLVAANYSINVGKMVGNRRFWDDIQMVIETNFPEMTNLSRQISDPELMIQATDDAYRQLKEEAAKLGRPAPSRGSGDVASRSIFNLDNLARTRGKDLYGEPFERLGGADYMSLVTGGKFPSGDSAVLDAINLMVTRGDNVADVQEQLLAKFGLEITASEAKSFTRGQTYMPASLRDFVRAQLGHSSLATGLRGLPPGLKEPLQLFMDSLDNVNEVFKGLVTVVWPRFHGRNAWGGMIANSMVHGSKSLEPQLQKKFVMMLSKEGADIPFTWGKYTHTGSEWQDIMRRTHVTPDRGGVADIEAAVTRAGDAGLGPSEMERIRIAADRAIKKWSEGGDSRLEVWDELVDYLYGVATMKRAREAYSAEKYSLPSTGIVHKLSGGKVGVERQVGRLKTGPAGKALTGTVGGLVVGLKAGASSGDAGVTVGSGIVGSAIGFLSTMPSEKLIALGGEIGLLTEVQLRGTNFVTGLELGHSIDQAAWLATHTHFNYTAHGQSWFSYNVMRRAMPFWTWNSKNFKKQLWLMRHRPQEYAALQHIITTATHYESSPELEASLPPSFASRISVKMAEGAWHGFGTPFEAFVENLRPQTEGGLPGSAGAAGLANPMALWLYEEAFDRSLYFDKPLEEIRSARDLQYLGWAPFLQEYFGAGPSQENPDIWKLGVLDSDRPENRDKPWIPDSIKEATTRWNRVRKLNSFAGLLSMWQQVRAEAYQDAYGELDPSGMKVTIPERIARTGLSWRRYHYDSNEASVKEKAWRRMRGRLGAAAEKEDPQGWGFHGGMKKDGYDPFATEESDELLRELLLQSDQQDPLQQ